MATKRQASAPVDPKTGEVLDGTFGDEDQDLSKFAEDNAPAPTRAAFTKLQMMELANAEDPLALLAQYTEARGISEIASVTDVLGDGTALLEKSMLINREFYVIDWRFHPSAKIEGRTFCAVKCMDMNKPVGAAGRMFVFTDGGVGIHEELAMFQLKNDNQTVPMHAPYGLSPSTYPVTDRETGEPTGETGTTYYFANAPTKIK